MSTYNLLNGYVGSKTPYISKIKALFDKSCTKYIEPYCGGAGVYFSNYNGEYEKEWLNDCNANIAILYRALSDIETRGDTMKALLEIEKPEDEEKAKEQFQRAKERMASPAFGKWCGRDLRKVYSADQMVEYARNAFLVYSQSFNCSAESYSRHKPNGKYQSEVKRNLKNVMERLESNPIVTCHDGIKIIKSLKEKSYIQMFIDWPYVGLYRRQSKLYASEMADLYSHILGAVALSGSKSAVVMCGYRSPKEGIPTIYDAILTGDEWHCFKIADTHSQCMVVKTGEKKAVATEYVWTNRVPKYAGLYISLYDYKEKITLEEYWERIKNADKCGLLSAGEILEYEYAYMRFCNKRLFDTAVLELAMKQSKNKELKQNIRLLSV